MAKRDVEAFGDDTSKSGGLTAKSAGSFGNQTDATPGLVNDEPKGKQRTRPVRAWGYMPRASMGKLQQDHDRGDVQSRQNCQTGEFMTDGGNSAGRQMQGVEPSFVADCQGRSGQPDNQSTNRPKGST